MKKTVFAIVIVLSGILSINAQQKEVKKENIHVKLKDGVHPDIYVDGKKFDFPIELIDQSKIASVFVVKGNEAIKKYNAPNGVVLIKTKASKKIDILELKGNASQKLDAKKDPMIIIDGKVSDKKTLDKLTPNSIEKMEVFKGQKALEKYNSPNGVIVITTKQKN